MGCRPALLALTTHGLLLLLVAVNPVKAAALTWERVPATVGAAPGPRRDAGIVYDAARRRLVLFGGMDARRNHMNDTWAFSFATSSWSRLQPSIAPTGRSSFVAGHWTASARNEYIIATGQRDGGQLKDIWALDLTTDQWRQLPSDNAPQRRYGAVGGIWPGQDKLWLSHGFASMRYSDTYEYDLNLEAWEEVHGTISSYDPTAPHPRCLSAGGLASPSHLVLYGGCQQNGFTGGPCPSRDTWIMRTDTATWTAADLALNGRNFAAMARLPGAGNEGLMLLYGGSESGGQVIRNSRAPDEEVDVLNAYDGTWARLSAAAAASSSMPGWRAGPSLTTTDDGLVMFGGELRDGGALQNDLWVLTGNVLETPALDQPAPSYFLYPMLHGLFMFLGWGVCLQAGWVVARYCRHKEPLWFKLHRALNMAGLLLSSIGFILVYVGGAKNPVFAHGIIGIAVTLLGLWQPVNAYFRPHKTPPGGTLDDQKAAGTGSKGGRRKVDRRQMWELLHKGSGRLAAVMALVNIALGVLLVGAPVGVWAVWFALLGAFIVVVGVLEVQFRRHTRASACKQKHREGSGGADTCTAGITGSNGSSNAAITAGKDVLTS